MDHHLPSHRVSSRAGYCDDFGLEEKYDAQCLTAAISRTRIFSGTSAPAKGKAETKAEVEQMSS